MRFPCRLFGCVAPVDRVEPRFLPRPFLLRRLRRLKCSSLHLKLIAGSHRWRGGEKGPCLGKGACIVFSRVSLHRRSGRQLIKPISSCHRPKLSSDQHQSIWGGSRQTRVVGVSTGIHMSGRYWRAGFAGHCVERGGHLPSDRSRLSWVEGCSQAESLFFCTRAPRPRCAGQVAFSGQWKRK